MTSALVIVPIITLVCGIYLFYFFTMKVKSRSIWFRISGIIVSLILVILALYNVLSFP